jgi:nucleoid-associated protein YgaU
MVIVKKGWTLKTIAAKYKVPGGWRAIGKIQRPPITDPRKVKTGQHIRMP